MGKYKRKRQNKDGKKSSDGKRSKIRKRSDEPYPELIRESKIFETYYKAQNFVSEEEWANFLCCMKSDLPAAFRVTCFRDQCDALIKLIHTYAEIKNEKINEKKIDLSTIPWYPQGLGYQLNLTRNDIRRTESFWRLHQFLISETETGNISRQETVSMIPPLLLDVKPGHKILDLCAAPGSKTAQIIEIMHSKESFFDEGVVVANDVDNRRCYMLTHQVKRLQSPSLVIVNHDASQMPNINYTRDDGTVGALKFDRILCDVPCSGDGTLRKNYDVWSKWNAVNGANMHGLQLRIARRGLEMLQVGGRLVYSTCSLNPLENEAVVNRLLSEFEGCISLVEVRDQLPGLKSILGLEDWTVMTRNLEVVKSAEEIPPQYSNYIHKHLFPPDVESRSKRMLNRCIRILPHHQDTGGFFVAVLQKTSALPGEKIYGETDSGNIELKAHNRTQSFKPPPKKRQCRGYKEEPFYYMSQENEFFTKLAKFYDFDPELDPGLFLTRAVDGQPKNFYFTNALVKDIVKQNENRLKIINTGVKVFSRCENKGSQCNNRLSQEGIHVILPYINKRKIFLTKSDLVSILSCNDTDIPTQNKTLDLETQQQSEKLIELDECGSVVFIYEGAGFTEDVKIKIQIVGWLGNSSVRAYVVKNERAHFLRLLGADCSAFEANKYKNNEIQEKQREIEKNSKNQGKNGENCHLGKNSVDLEEIGENLEEIEMEEKGEDLEEIEENMVKNKILEEISDNVEEMKNVNENSEHVQENSVKQENNENLKENSEHVQENSVKQENNEILKENSVKQEKNEDLKENSENQENNEILKENSENQENNEDLKENSENQENNEILKENSENQENNESLKENNENMNENNKNVAIKKNADLVDIVEKQTIENLNSDSFVVNS